MNWSNKPTANAVTEDAMRHYREVVQANSEKYTDLLIAINNRIFERTRFYLVPVKYQKISNASLRLLIAKTALRQIYRNSNTKQKTAE